MQKLFVASHNIFALDKMMFVKSTVVLEFETKKKKIFQMSWQQRAPRDAANVKELIHEFSENLVAHEDVCQFAALYAELHEHFPVLLTKPVWCMRIVIANFLNYKYGSRN